MPVPASPPCCSLPSSACSDIMGSSRPAVVGVFILWKLASTTHQGLFFSFRKTVYQNATGLMDLDGGKGSKVGAHSRGYWQRGTPVSLTQAFQSGEYSWHRHRGAHLATHLAPLSQVEAQGKKNETQNRRGRWQEGGCGLEQNDLH